MFGIYQLVPVLSPNRQQAIRNHGDNVTVVVVLCESYCANYMLRHSHCTTQCLREREAAQLLVSLLFTRRFLTIMTHHYVVARTTPLCVMPIVTLLASFITCGIDFLPEWLTGYAWLVLFSITLKIFNGCIKVKVRKHFLWYLVHWINVECDCFLLLIAETSTEYMIVRTYSTKQ